MEKPAITVLASLNQGLHKAFEQDPNVYLLGEDILDPYGGAFKVTQGLSTAFPGRVITTPISEAGVVGVACGMALRGLRPVVEIMFGDFITLIADQLVNHIAKFRWMYNDQVRVPLVIRTPMGGRRGYGPTHSQTLEKMFLGVPGIRVLAASHFHFTGELLAETILHSEDPVLFIENKLLYPLSIIDQTQQTELFFQIAHSSKKAGAPAFTTTVCGAPPASITMVSYGYMAELARQSLLNLAYQEEIFTELVTLIQLAPFEIEAVIDSVRHTGKLLVIEEGNTSLGWGAEILARTSEELGGKLKAAHRVGGREHPIPSSPSLELQSLPGLETIQNAARHLEYMEQIMP